MSSGFRILEPKAIEIVTDGVLGQQANGNAGFFSSLVYHLLPKDNFKLALVVVASIFLGLALLRSLTQLCANWLSIGATEDALKELRERLFSHIQNLPMEHFSHQPSGELVQRCTGDIDTLHSFLSSQVVEIVRLSAIFLLSVWLMADINPIYTLVCVSMTPFMVLVSYWFFKKEKQIFEDHETVQDKFTDKIAETIGGIRVIQAFSQEERYLDELDKHNAEKRKAGVRHIVLHQYFWPVSDMMIFGQMALSLSFGAHLLLSGHITLGQYATFNAYSLMVSWPMRNLGRILSQMGMALVAIGRIERILDTPVEEDLDLDGFDYQTEIKGFIVFENVGFKYPNTDKWILQGLSFELKAGQQIAVMGRTGVGKTTLIALLNRLYEPVEGKIYLDGKPLDHYPKSFLRKKIGIAHQQPFLFSETLSHNISYAYPAASMSEIEQAAQMAHIHSFINASKEGYETEIGEKGLMLSGGQRQRVALARAFVSKPPILVLDDTTSALDSALEADIQKMISTELGGKTLLVITHRASMASKIGHVLVLEDGKSQAMGAWEEISQQSEFLREVVGLQGRNT